LIGEVATPLPTRLDQSRCVDNDYERLGVSSEVIFSESFAGCRHVKVTDCRTKKNCTECIRELLDVDYPEAWKIRLVPDNLHTHTGGWPLPGKAAEKARILDRLEFHDTLETRRTGPHQPSQPRVFAVESRRYAVLSDEIDRSALLR
jgi:hypothetical protein